MKTDSVISQIVLAKRIYMQGCDQISATDPISCGIAVSMFQDAVEMMVWTLLKKMEIAPKDPSTFTSNLDLLRKNGVLVAGTTPGIQELNKARVGFKHYGNLPAPSDMGKFQASTEDFLRSVVSQHFNLNFDDVSLVDAVSFEEIRLLLKEAEAAITLGAFDKAVCESSKAKGLLFSWLDPFIPEVDPNLASLDHYIERNLKVPGEVDGSYVSGQVNGFSYVARYLERIRESMFASLLKLPFDQYYFLSRTLFSAHQSLDGEWRVVRVRDVEYTKEICAKQIKCIAEMSFQVCELLRQETPVHTSRD